MISGYKALAQDSQDLFRFIEQHIKGLVGTNNIFNTLLLGLYNECIFKNNHTDNILISATSLSNALKIARDDSLPLQTGPKAATFYNQALIAIRYHKFDEALCAIEEFQKLTPEDPDLQAIEDILTRSLSFLTDYIPQLRKAELAHEIIEKYPDYYKIYSDILSISEIDDVEAQRVRIEKLSGDSLIPEDLKIHILTSSSDPVKQDEGLSKIKNFNTDRTDVIWLSQTILSILHNLFSVQSYDIALKRLNTLKKTD
jgi:hypothetical protein